VDLQGAAVRETDLLLSGRWHTRNGSAGHRPGRRFERTFPLPEPKYLLIIDRFLSRVNAWLSIVEW